jgi:hypothetical protein
MFNLTNKTKKLIFQLYLGSLAKHLNLRFPKVTKFIYKVTLDITIIIRKNRYCSIHVMKRIHVMKMHVHSLGF